MDFGAIEEPGDGNPKVAKSKRYTRYILDPFQIFCIEKRNEYMKAHPKLKNSGITSMLAGIWREMSDSEKMQYNLIAMKLQNNKCKVERKIKKNPSRTDSSKDSKGSSTPEISEPDLEADGNPAFKTSNPPKIYIISRTGVGEDLSEVSYNLLKMQEKSYEEE
ncbi:HMG box family protein [Trichomonas vaginalis G3]|uniref:HMG box family protein n=1 Tax=Trichomonas vaginalis (strain ATCC PRA-98 / G3) TaxID=412133 RepID=A2DL77_TRIV3|nr:HMG-box family [Trichomonas vaginalis G3]EAY18868.1 HMG box family protein [Trichomonas vaginalis G3]KAI5526013.1 HMG-box family [Trichomonas vaginalis G3]|eukprot:XP_001579854.1 HMG box family protein [Trichomonas vaginalis G3]